MRFKVLQKIISLKLKKPDAPKQFKENGLIFMMSPLPKGQNRGLLVWNSTSTYRAKNMKNCLDERKI